MGRVAHSTTYFYNLPVCFCHCLLHQWGWFYSEKRAYTCGVSSRYKNHIDTKDDKEDRWCQFLSSSATSRIMTAYKKNNYISRFVTVKEEIHWGIGLKRPVVRKPKYSMTALGSRAAPDCRTDIARTHVQSQLLSLVTVICPGYYCTTFLENPHLLVKFIMWRLQFCYFQILAMLPQVLFTMCCAFFCQSKFVKNKRQKRCYNSHSSGLQ